MPTSNSSVVNAIYYLANGVGAQKYVNSNKDAEDIPTTISQKPSVTLEGGGVVSNYFGGYEMGKNQGMGISITRDNLEPKYDIIEGTYADLTTSVRKAQYLTTMSNTNILHNTEMDKNIHSLS